MQKENERKKGKKQTTGCLNIHEMLTMKMTNAKAEFTSSAEHLHKLLFFSCDFAWKVLMLRLYTITIIMCTRETFCGKNEGNSSVFA